MKYHIITFGCQMNHSDSERIAAVFEKMGFKKALKAERADFLIVNMCSIRQSAVDRVYGVIEKNKNLKLKTILTGCISKKDKIKFEKIFDYVIDIKEIGKLPDILGIKENIFNNDYLKIKPRYSSKFSANVPIMTGCNNFCAYCVVPFARGREVSRPAEEIIKEVKGIIKNKGKEIWLLGQNVNSYKGEVSFPELLRMVNDIKGDFWIRFTSSHPKDFSDDLIKAMKECEKLPKYLNLPVQAGDDEILKKMNRPYTIKQYKNLIKKIRAKMPDIAISTDIIVGFPGETKAQFNNSVKLFKEIKFDMAYVSKYSLRPGTAAEKMKDNVPFDEKKRREAVLNKILGETALINNKKMIGKIQTVLIDSSKGNMLFGKTEGYKTIKIKASKKLVGKFVKVKITEALPWGLKGIL